MQVQAYTDSNGNVGDLLQQLLQQLGDNAAEYDAKLAEKEAHVQHLQQQLAAQAKRHQAELAAVREAAVAGWQAQRRELQQQLAQQEARQQAELAAARDATAAGAAAGCASSATYGGASW